MVAAATIMVIPAAAIAVTNYNQYPVMGDTRGRIFVAGNPVSHGVFLHFVEFGVTIAVICLIRHRDKADFDTQEETP